MDKLKNVKYIESLKNKPMKPFKNAYEALIMNLENNLRSKTNGRERNEAILSGYDEESKKILKKELEKRMSRD